MTPARLDEILAAYGADPDRWPAAEREAARLAAAGRAPALHAAAQLDSLLDRLAAAPPSDDLARRIVAASRTVPQAQAPGSGLWRWLASVRPMPGMPQFAGLAAALLVGFWLGITSPAPADAQDLYLDSVIAPAAVDTLDWLG